MDCNGNISSSQEIPIQKEQKIYMCDLCPHVKLKDKYTLHDNSHAEGKKKQFASSIFQQPPHPKNYVLTFLYHFLFLKGKKKKKTMTRIGDKQISTNNILDIMPLLFNHTICRFLVFDRIVTPCKNLVYPIKLSFPSDFLIQSPSIE